MGAENKRSLVRRLVDRVPAQSASGWDAAIHGFLVLFCLFAPHSIALTQGAFYTALALWLVKIMWRRQWPRSSSRLDVPIGLFVGLTVLSSIFSYEPTVSLKKLGSVSLVLIVLLVVHQVRSLRWAKMLVLMMVTSCLINVGYVFWEKVRGRGLQIVQLSPKSPLAEAGLRPGDVILEVDGRVVHSLAELMNQSAGKRRVALFVYRPEIYFRRTLPVGSWATAGDLGVRVRRWRRFRAAGFYGWNYFTYAEVLQLLAAVAFGLLLEVQRKRSWIFILLAIAVVAMGGAIILTVTRAVWVAFALALLVMSLRAMHRRAVLLVLVVGLVVAPWAVKILHQTRGQPFFSLREPSIAYRLAIWSEGIDLLRRRPRHLLVGIGMDSLKYRWREWGLFEGGRLPLGHMHSTPLQIALERGLPALLCFVWWFGVYLALLWRLTDRRRASLDWVGRGIALGLFGGTVGFLLSSLVHYNFGDSEVVMVVYFLMGIAVVMGRGAEEYGATGG